MSKFMKYLLILLFIFGLQTCANANKWGSGKQCREMWPNCGSNSEFKNIVCEVKTCGPRVKHCYQMTISTEFRKRNLQHHNEKRDLVASGEETRAGAVQASNMHVLNYDLGLEYTAICHANKCEQKHDKCRGTKRFPEAGQNLALRGETDINPYDLYHVEKSINNWYNELSIEGFQLTIDKYKFVHGAGHMTQVIWADTTHIGCGWSYLNKTNSLALMFLTCNYAPPGNWAEEPMYKRGEPCSACAANESCGKKFTHLCGEEDGKNLEGPNPYDGASGIKTWFGLFKMLFVSMVVMYLYG